MIYNPISLTFWHISKLCTKALNTSFKPSVAKSKKDNTGDENAKKDGYNNYSGDKPGGGHVSLNNSRRKYRYFQQWGQRQRLD